MYSFTACRCCMQAVRSGYAVFSRMLLRLYLSLLPVIGFISQNFFDLFVCIMLFMLLNCKMVFTLCCCCCVASVVSDSVWPHRRQPTKLPHPWDSPGKNTGVGCHFLLQCMKVKRESEVAQLCPTIISCCLLKAVSGFDLTWDLLFKNKITKRNQRYLQYLCLACLCVWFPQQALGVECAWGRDGCWRKVLIEGPVTWMMSESSFLIEKEIPQPESFQKPFDLCAVSHVCMKEGKEQWGKWSPGLFSPCAHKELLGADSVCVASQAQWVRSLRDDHDGGLGKSWRTMF